MLKICALLYFLLLYGFTVIKGDLVAYECPNGWYDYMSHCYRFVRDPVADRLNSKKSCTKDGAYLLSVNDAKEDEFVSNQLNQIDQSQLRQNWWTSGQRKAAGQAQFYWEGDGTLIDVYVNWINDSIPQQLYLDYIVYHYNGYKWGWILSLPNQQFPYICEISKDDLYKISQDERGPDYGIDNPDRATLDRGPTLIVQPKNTVYEQQNDQIDFSTELDCRADAYPSATYQWIREIDGKIVDINPVTNPKYTIVNGRLIISKPSTSGSDDGKYQCKTSNKFGLVLSNIATLSGGYLQDFPKSPISPVQATSFQWATIECSPPAHYPDILYAWYKDYIYNFVRPDVKPYIMISNDGRLYFSEVTSDDVGEYYCLVYKPGQSLAQGKVSMPTQLIIKSGSPGIYEPQIGDGFPKVYPAAPKVGDAVRIECWASGSSRTYQLVYLWEKVVMQNGKVVQVIPLPNQATLTDHNRVLQINNINMYDEGTYRCTVQRVNGQSTSKTVNVILQSIPYFTLGITNQYVDVGTDLKWRCEAQGPPPPQYAWYKNGVKLDNTTIKVQDINRVIVSNNWLTILSVNAISDNGMYQCEAGNTLGKRYSSAELKVLSFPPTFTKYPLPQNQYATELGNTTLFCRPEAAPYPTTDQFIWYKNGSPLNVNTANVHKLSNGNLFIQNLARTDSGLYRCSVTTSQGSASTQGNLTVLATTTLAEPPRDTTVRLNRTTFLHCLASHNPLIDVTYVWYDENMLIEFEKIFRLGENRYEIWKNPHYKRGTGLYVGGLYIMNAQYEHAGKYTCIVESSAGMVSRSANVYVIGPPSEPAGVYVVSSTVTTSSAVVQWKASGDNGSPITSYVVETLNFWEGFWRIALTNVVSQPDEYGLFKVNVTNLRPYSNYQIRLRAENAEGTSVPSLPSDQFTTYPVVPDLAPDFVGGGGGKVGELTINWQPLQPWQHNADGIGYRVHIKVVNSEAWDWIESVSGNVGSYVKLVGELNFYQEYVVAVQSFNKIGLGPISNPSTIRSAMGLPVIIAQNVRAQPYNSTACLIHWEPVKDARDQLKGRLGGYRISYWQEFGGTELGAPRVTINGQASEGLVIGLYPNTPYYFDVMVWNEAGNGPKSQYFIQRTLRNAPINMPVEVQVTRINYHTIHVKWRGVSTTQVEEPLEGYMVRIWYEGENMKVARDYNANKENDLEIDDLRPDIVYKLRVFGYSRGGVGAMSSPAIKFLLGAGAVKSYSFLTILISLAFICLLKALKI